EPRFSEAVDEDAVRGLRPDLGKRNELVVGCRHVAPISIEEDPANLLDLDRLLPVEPYRLNQALEIPGICIREGAGRVIFREQLSRRPLRHLVSSSLGQDRRNEDEERILPFSEDLRYDGLLFIKVPCGDDVCCECLYVEGTAD